MNITTDNFCLVSAIRQPQIQKGEVTPGNMRMFHEDGSESDNYQSDLFLKETRPGLHDVMI